MSIRLARVVLGLLVVAVVVLTAGRSWAIYFGLGPSKDEWGLKYDVAIEEVDSNTLQLVFTVADEGRLKPFYKLDLVAFSRQTDRRGGRAYDVDEPIKLKPTADGKRVGTVRFRKQFADRAMIRIITLTVDGQRRRSGAFYDIPIAKYLKKTSAPPTVASPPGVKVTK